MGRIVSKPAVMAPTIYPFPSTPSAHSDQTLRVPSDSIILLETGFESIRTTFVFLSDNDLHRDGRWEFIHGWRLLVARLLHTSRSFVQQVR
jgi:hypothetical protein